MNNTSEMGTNFSSLNCSKNKKGKKRKKKLSKTIDRQRDSLESLHSTAANVLPKFSSNDQSLVEEKIRSVGNKHVHLQERIERARQQYEGVSANLSDIKEEVDKYLLWLTKQEQMISEKVGAGKHLQSAEIRLKNSKILCEELQSKKATIETVKRKVEELIRDLPYSERVVVDDWVTEVCDQHQRVYSLAADHQKLLANSVEQRERVHCKLQQLCQWLQKKEKEIGKFHHLRLASQDVEKQLERCRALQNEVTDHKEQIDELQKRSKMLHIDCTADELTQIKIKCSEVDTRYTVLVKEISTCHNYLRDTVASRRNFESDLLKNDKWCRETEMRCASEPVVDCPVELLEEQLVHYKSLQKTSKMFQSLGKVIEETGLSFKPKLVEEDKLKMAQQLKNAREQYIRCADLIQYRLQCIEATVSAKSETEEKIRETSRWIENIEKDLEELSKNSEFDIADRERVLEKFEAIGESLSIYQPTVAQLNQESDRLHNSGQSIDARRIVDITTKYEILQDQVTEQRKKIHKELVLLQQHQSQSEHFESLSSECKSKLDEVDYHQEIGQEMKTLKGVSHSVPDLLAVCEELPRERSASFDLKRISSAARDTRLKQLRTSWSDLLFQIGAEEQQLQDAVQNQGQYLLAVQRVNTQLDRIQSNVTEEFDMTDNVERCIEDFQKSLCEFNDMKREIVKLKEHGMKLVDPSQPDSFKTMQSAFKMLSDRVENLQVFAEIRSTQMKTIQKEVEVQEAAHEESIALGKHIDLSNDEKPGEAAIEKPRAIHALLSSLSKTIEKKSSGPEEILQLWHECKTELEKEILWLKDMRIFLSASIPCEYEELQLDYKKCMDIERGFQTSDTQQRLLHDKEKSLSNVITSEDFNVLNEQILLLNKHWHEINALVSQRKIQIQDIMMRWTEFQKNVSGLHEWIDKMEYRILTDQEYDIEDLLRKFSKEYHDEILVKEKYKNRLLEEGQKLLKISKQNQIPDIQSVIKETEDKWTHLSNTMRLRKRKLEETMLAVRQLDTSMANLQKWLSDIEHELSTSLYFMKSEEIEFKTKLQHQKDLQRDIEHHSLGVGSVLNLCEVLLHDSDACPSEVEFSALQTAMKNLDLRWKHICEICPKRSLRIKEIWITLETLKEDCTVFENWLKSIRLEIDSSVSDQINTHFSKKEEKHFQQIMEDILEVYCKLEKMNKAYRQLAREGRTDFLGTLKSTIFYCNKEWDILQHRVSSILMNLKQSAALEDDFKTMKNGTYKWLTDIDVRVTDLEHFSSMSTEAKIAEVQKIEKEIDFKEKDMRSLDSYALLLMKSEDVANARTIQREVEELKNYMRAVTERAYQFSKNLKLQSIISSDLTSDILLEYEPYMECLCLESPLEEHMVGSTADGNQKTKDMVHQLEIMQNRVFEMNLKWSHREPECSKFVIDVEITLCWLHDVVTDQNYIQSASEKSSSLDTIIKYHKNYLMHLDSKKTKIQSLNLLGKDFIDLQKEEGRQLHDKLKEINFLWDKLCSRAVIQQRELQKALIQCQEFHRTIHDLLLWLEGVENKLQQCEPINLVMDETAIWSKLRTLSSLKVELENNKERILGLKDTTDKLFSDKESDDMMIAQEKMHIIANRHNALMKLCSSYMASIENLLQVPISSIKRQHFQPGNNPQQLQDDRKKLSTKCNRRMRCLWRSLLVIFLQILVLILTFASIAPVCEDVYSCDFVNNFNKSFVPMLRFIDGTPPV